MGTYLWLGGQPAWKPQPQIFSSLLSCQVVSWNTCLGHWSQAMCWKNKQKKSPKPHTLYTNRKENNYHVGKSVKFSLSVLDLEQVFKLIFPACWLSSHRDRYSSQLEKLNLFMWVEQEPAVSSDTFSTAYSMARKEKGMQSEWHWLFLPQGTYYC